MPQRLIEDGQTFHICLDSVDSGQTLACYKMANHEGKHVVESLTIDAKDI